MNKHLYLAGIYAEKPFRLDNLEAFVHHRGGVYCNLRSHVPSGVLQSIGLRDTCYLLFRHQSERTSRGSKQNLFDGVVALAYNALEYRGVLAVNGEYRRVVLHCQSCDEFSGNNQSLFVGKAYLLLRLNGVDSGRKSCKTHHRREHHINGVGLHNLVNGASAGIHLHFRNIAEHRLQFIVMCLVGNHYCCRTELSCLFGEFFHAVVCCQAIHLI